MAGRLFLFNPDCELAIANGSPFYMPPSNIVQMANDLAYLPAYMAEEGDYIFMSQYPETSFLEFRNELLGYECRPVAREDIQALNIRTAEPWGWSPKVCHQLSAFNLSETWMEKRKDLYSRKKAKEVLAELAKTLPFVESGIIPQICCSLEEMVQSVSEARYIAKAPWSSSGKGLLALNGKVTSKEVQWLTGMFRRQGYMMLEKRLDKVFDFAMEFHITESNLVEFIGLSAFQTGENGEYRGNYVGGQEGVEKHLSTYVGEDILAQVKKQLIQVLSERLSFEYQGYLGVDMMIYRDIHGHFRIQPCVEINLRYNMGIVALFVSRRCLADGVQGTFSINYHPAKGEAYQHHLVKQNECPLIIENKRIKHGYLNLTPIFSNTHFTAEVVVG